MRARNDASASQYKQAKTNVFSNMTMSFLPFSPWNPNNLTVMASANANDGGTYAIAGVAGCFSDEMTASAFMPNRSVMVR